MCEVGELGLGLWRCVGYAICGDGVVQVKCVYVGIRGERVGMWDVLYCEYVHVWHVGGCATLGIVDVWYMGI